MSALTPEALAELRARPGRDWLPGLTAEDLAAYESELGVRLPDDARLLLRTMNGDSSGEFYSYPRDLERVRERMDRWRADWDAIAADLASDGVVLPPAATAVPLWKHRGVLCAADPKDSRVLSIVEGDAVLYAESVAAWLDLEFPRR